MGGKRREVGRWGGGEGPVKLDWSLRYAFANLAGVARGRGIAVQERPQ
jgi:hypothetical protein